MGKIQIHTWHLAVEHLSAGSLLDFFVAFMTLTLLKITGENSLQTVTQFGLMFLQKQIHSGFLLKKYHTVHQCSCQSDEQVLICPDTADIPFDPLIKRCF